MSVKMRNHHRVLAVLHAAETDEVKLQFYVQTHTCLNKIRIITPKSIDSVIVQRILVTI